VDVLCLLGFRGGGGLTGFGGGFFGCVGLDKEGNDKAMELVVEKG
jgi:hypothetical protein